MEEWIFPLGAFVQKGSNKKQHGKEREQGRKESARQREKSKKQ